MSRRLVGIGKMPDARCQVLGFWDSDENASGDRDMGDQLAEVLVTTSWTFAYENSSLWAGTGECVH